MQVGTLPRREFVIGGIFDDELFADIKEKKLATLLATEVLENEYTWLNYEFEESQVKIDLGDMILEHLVSEVIAILEAIETKRTGGDLNYKSIYKSTDFMKGGIISGAHSILNSEDDDFFPTELIRMKAPHDLVSSSEDDEDRMGELLAAAADAAIQKKKR
jgi:hypothetical protein